MAKKQSFWTLRAGDQNFDHALEGCPAPIRKKVGAMDASLREVPEIVFGREADLEYVMNRILTATDPSNSEEAQEGTAIVSPPGAGKTSLLHLLQKEAKKRKITVLKINAIHLTDPDRFSRKILELPPWNKREVRKQALRAIKYGTAKAEDEATRILSTAGLNRLFNRVGNTASGPVDRVLQAWEEGRPPNMDDAIRLLSESSEHGVLVVIDEAQELVQYRDHIPQRDNIQSVLQMLNDPIHRRANGAPNATLVVAGMRDTDEVVGFFTTVPPKVHVLEPVSRCAATKMIAHEIGQANTTPQARTKAEGGWTKRLVDRYGDWTRHVQCGAEAARRVLAVAGERALHEDWGVPLLVSTADRYRQELFEQVIERGVKYGVDREMQHTIVELLNHRDGRLPPPSMVAVVHRLTGRQRVQQGRSGGGDAKREGEDNLRNMVRAGLIDIRNGAYTAPIPSLRRHMTETNPYGTAVVEQLAALELDNLGKEVEAGSTTNKRRKTGKPNSRVDTRT